MSKKIKLLIADDDPYILMSLEFLFKKNDFDVLIARNGSEAMEIFNNNQPEVAILDIMMPDMDGYSLCQYVKNKKSLHHIKIVFLSAKSSESDIQKGYKAGADLFITKPFSTRTIVKQIMDVINNQ